MNEIEQLTKVDFIGNKITEPSRFSLVSQQIWREIKKGTPYEIPDPPKEYTADFYGAKQNEGVKINELIDFIKCNNDSLNNGPALDWKNYTSTQITETFSYPNSYGFSTVSEVSYDPNTKWKYKDQNNKENSVNIQAIINKRVGDYIDSEYNHTAFIITYDSELKKIVCQIYFYFQKTLSNKNFSESITPGLNNVTIDNKYLAIRLSTYNLKDFYYLWENIIGNTEGIAKKVKYLLLTEKDPKTLNLLYRELNEELLPKLAKITNNNEKKIILNHLSILKKLDEDHLFYDTSQAILNLLCIVKDTQLIYDYFYQHSVFLKQLYHNLDGNTEFMGQEIPSKVFLGQLLFGIALQNKFKGFEQQNYKTFKIDNSHRVYTHINNEKDHPDKIFLQQMQQVKSRAPVVDRDENGIGILTGEEKENFRMEEIDEGNYFSLLEPVLLEIKENGQTYTLLVPAIFVKSLADEKQWVNLMKVIRLGINALFIIIGILTLGSSATPTAVALALLDIGITTFDSVMVIMEDQLLQSPEGKQFLDTYNTIMLGVGVVLAPLLLANLAKLGLVLLKTAQAQTRTFIKTCLMNAILKQEIIKFEKQASLLLADELALSAQNKIVFQRLEDQGVVYLVGTRQGDKTEKIFATYDDFILAEIENNPKGITNFASQWRIFRNEKLLKSKLIEDALYIRIFRVQGGKVKPNISKFRFKIKGSKIEIEGDNMLHLTFDDTKRVAHFWEKRGSESVVFTAEIKKSFYDKIKREAVEQEYAKAFPNRPQIDDPTKTNNSFGIPKEYFNELLKSMKNPEIIKI
ncbi:MAG TPA: hypothetical protein DEQ26_01820, partial [Flavobacteriaceae bacterium]|nr:hypothetical protein [Flavobacteriaceae bacterium]